MGATDLDEPHCSHRRKNNLFSLERMVSGLLQPLHMTYSLIYLLSIASKFFGANLPLITNLCCPSRDPLVPISASKNIITCSGCLCIVLHKSMKFTKTVFFVPSVRTTRILLVIEEELL
uniref:Uncharacterized protein n=1 Tax=Zea mays TaxID=4577 RepID=C4J7I7_MAIZE|nr:unknown [Zea mays]